MNKMNGTLGTFLILILTAVPASGYYSRQYSWVGGPGVSGPVGTNWGTTFDSHSSMSWDALPGEIFLTISSTQHLINNDMAGCKWAFPADMDGDGDLDAVASEISTSTPYKVAWFENDGSGGGWDMHIISENYAVIRCAYPADIDCDGDIDVIGSNTAMSKEGLEWFRNDDGVGDSWTRFRIAYWGSPLFVCCSDIDGNDTLDIVAPGWTNETIYWWESHTWPPDSSWWGHSVTSGVHSGREIFPVDMDQDNDPDILCADDYFYGLNWFENPDSIGVEWTEHRIGGYNDGPYSANSADIDGDGDYDVIFCIRDNAGKVSWFENLDGVGTDWEEHVLETDYYYPQGVWAEDMTGDGYTDILLSGHSECCIYVNRDGTGSEWSRHHICNGSTSIRPADITGNGKMDVLTGASSVYWHELEGHTSGWLESSILDVNSYPQWDSITWVAEEPAGTDIFFQIRTSNDWEDMGAWCDTIFEPQSLDFGTDRYIQYRVGMTSDIEFVTPVLDEVRFYWTYLGIEGDVNPEDFTVSAYPNPSSGSVTIGIPAGFTPDAEILVYDLAGNLVRRFADLETNVIPWDCDDESGDQVPSGMYLIRAISGDQVRTMRLVRL